MRAIAPVDPKLSKVEAASVPGSLAATPAPVKSAHPAQSADDLTGRGAATGNELAALQVNANGPILVPVKRTVAATVAKDGKSFLVEPPTPSLAPGETAGPSPVSARANGGPLPVVAGSQSLGDALREKNAVAPILALESETAGKTQDKKDFLTPGRASVSVEKAGVGTGVAKMSAAMTPFAPSRSKTDLPGESMPVGLVSAATLPPLVFSLDAPAPTASLRETMAAVITAVEALERRELAGRNSVDLQFNIGEERLALRVELREGAVHTTFRTDSHELRAALAQEWQSVVHGQNPREGRLADPVFGSSLASGTDSPSSSLGQGTPHQRGHATPESAAAVFGRDLPPVAVAEPVAAAARTTSLLNAFA